MSSCDASCSICCHLGSYASATSDSSPTGNAPRCYRCAVGCWATQREQLRLTPLPKRLTLSGTAQSAEAPCASWNGSPPPNSYFDRHLHQTAAPHEALYTSPTYIRVPARSQILCLICPEPLACRALKLPLQPPASLPAAHPTLMPPDPTQL